MAPIKVNKTFMDQNYPAFKSFDLSKSDTDYYGNWQCNNGVKVCKDSDPVVYAQFMKSPFRDNVETEHWSIKIDILCEGNTYAFTVEFTPECGLRQRFGFYGNYLW